MKILRPALAIGVLAVLASCATAPGPNCVRLSARGFFCLVAPAALPAQQGTALVTVTRRHSTHHFVGQLSITARQMTLALLTLAGMPAATLHWDGQTAGIETSGKMPLKAQQLAALLELSLASRHTLDKALHGLTVTIEHSRSGAERRLMDGRTLVARARTDAHGTTHIEVPRLNLDITLKPLSSNTNE